VAAFATTVARSAYVLVRQVSKHVAAVLMAVLELGIRDLGKRLRYLAVVGIDTLIANVSILAAWVFVVLRRRD
jgi:hypothetical protein